MENQRIPGYRELTRDEFDAIRGIKQSESEIAGLHSDISDLEGVDARELGLARTHFEDAFMHLVKAVARPISPWRETKR